MQLDRIDRSFMILLRNMENNLRPVKWITKVLAAQRLITMLVDSHQSGFVKKRCIADNLLCAMDLGASVQNKKEEGSGDTRCVKLITGTRCLRCYFLKKPKKRTSRVNWRN